MIIYTVLYYTTKIQKLVVLPSAGYNLDRFLISLSVLYSHVRIVPL